MANSTNELFLDNVQLDLQDITQATLGLEKVLNRLQLRLQEVFSGMTIAQYLEDAIKATGKLDKELLVMRLALGKLRVAIGEAFAPIAQVVLPLINDAIFAAIRFAKSAGKVIRALFGVEESSSSAADAEMEYAGAVSYAAGVAKRSLASFDKLNRLQSQTGGGSSSSLNTGNGTGSRDEMDLKEYLAFYTLSNMLAPLKEIDLSPLVTELKALYEAMRPINKALFDGFRWAWDNIFVPVIRWSAEILLPEVVKTLAVALEALNKVIESCKPALTYLWENFLKPLGQWAGEYLLGQLENLQGRLEHMGLWAEMFPVSAEQVLVWMSQFTEGLISTKDLLSLFSLVTGKSGSQLSAFGWEMWSLTAPFSELAVKLQLFMGNLAQMDETMDASATAGQSAGNKLLAAWRQVGSGMQTDFFGPVAEGFRQMGEGVQGSFGSISGTAITGVNKVIKSLNQISFTIPEWVPVLGGKKFSFNIPTLPEIPMLAQGAVLPANKPFLAVVGDQHHGTNVEAPLTTIQEAVRLELQELVDSNLAGQEAIAGVLGQILEAVLGIGITEGDIAMAADRYHSKMAVVRGNLL